MKKNVPNNEPPNARAQSTFEALYRRYNRAMQDRVKKVKEQLDLPANGKP